MEEVKFTLTFEEIHKAYKSQPPVDYLWNGIKEKSIGIVFGPSKSGKTIFCENLALNLAIGSKEYFRYKLKGKPRKVLFIGLEEYWISRVERNEKQFNSLSDEQKELYKKNYLYQPINYLQLVIKKKHWEKLTKTVKESQAEIVFIDSITRMNHGNLEDSRIAQEIMQRLRDICYTLQITLVCIHHTPKMHNKPITMDSIKGSSVFAQESDFAIGINSTQVGRRYMKNIFFRYAPENNEKVKEFSMEESTILKLESSGYENVILNSNDRRRNDKNRTAIVDYLNTNSCKIFKTADLVDKFMVKLKLQERQIKNYLSDLVGEDCISSPKRGYYTSTNCLNLTDSQDEEE